MEPIEGQNCIAIGHPKTGYLIYPQGDAPSISVLNGKYQLYTIDMKNGAVKLQRKSLRLNSSFTATTKSSGHLLWLRKK